MTKIAHRRLHDQIEDGEGNQNDEKNPAQQAQDGTKRRRIASFHGLWFKLVPNAPDGLQVGWVGWIGFNLFPQAADMDGNSAGINVFRKAPDAFQ